MQKNRSSYAIIGALDLIIFQVFRYFDICAYETFKLVTFIIRSSS
jgi:hypothetical protein